MSDQVTKNDPVPVEPTSPEPNPSESEPTSPEPASPEPVTPAEPVVKQKKKKVKKPYEGPVTFYPMLDVMNLALDWTKHFHLNSNTPGFVLCGTRQQNKVWEVMDMLGQPVTLQNFYRTRVASLYRRLWFYKAERANQELMMSQIFANFCWHIMQRDANPLHYQGRRVTNIYLQWISVVGHRLVIRSLFEEDPGSPLINPVKATCLVGFEVAGGESGVSGESERFYLDFTSPQVDIYAWVNDPAKPEKNTRSTTGTSHLRNQYGYPLLKIPAVNLKAGQLYAPAYSKDVKIVSIDEPLEVDGDGALDAYLQVVEEENQQAEGDFDLSEYHRKIYKDFRDSINKSLANLKKKNKKKSKTKN